MANKALVALAVVAGILVVIWAVRRLTRPPKQIDVYLFSAEWCGACKSFAPEWDKFEGEAKLTSGTGTYLVRTHKVDCSSISKDALATDSKFKYTQNGKQRTVDSFPTVIARSEGHPAVDIRPNNSENHKQLMTNIQKMFPTSIF